VVRLKPKRKFAELSRLSHEVGWKYKGVIDALEAKRTARAKIYWEKKQEQLVSCARTTAVATTVATLLLQKSTSFHDKNTCSQK